MYHDHFKLREPPFSIAPDPSYLYLSARHQEALGHLLYGTGQYGGFVQLTGEVGTGKTTIIRTLLAQKLDSVDVAMIHNPRQSELEFVESICDELHVPHPPKASLKTLIDGLNNHLLRVHAAGRRAVLIIDEAQNLHPGVLEQVRLLTNLETDKEKLLRIMLVGQPELIELLARTDLRQLASRITARYHLLPLTLDETREYIVHRMRVAGSISTIFTPAAIDRIYRVTKGIPRQINIVCDRALLGAYARGLFQVTPEIVDVAVAETLGAPAVEAVQSGWRGALKRIQSIPLVWLELAVACVTLVVMLVLLWGFLTGRRLPISLRSASRPAASESAQIAVQDAASGAVPAPASQGGVSPAREVPAGTVSPAAQAANSVTSLGTSSGASGDMPLSGSAALTQLRKSAQPLGVLTGALLRLWEPKAQIPAGENVCKALAKLGLGCYRSTGDWVELTNLNRPALLTLNLGNNEHFYVLLRQLDTDTVILEGADGAHRYRLSQIDGLWTGEYFMLWYRPLDVNEVGPKSRGLPVQWVRRQLKEAGEQDLSTTTAQYDEALMSAVARFQESHGLVADGIVGTRTLIALADLAAPPSAPLLTPPVNPNPSSPFARR